MIDALRLLAVYGGSCAVVLWLVHRTLCPEGRPLRPGVAVLLALMPFAFTGRAMVTGGHYGALNLSYHTPPLEAHKDRLPRPDHEKGYDNGILMDQVCQVIPWRKAVREAVKTGHWPLWNRYARGGDVLLGASQPAPFDPKVWLGFLLPLATAVTFACAFVLFQAACFTWIYLRELGLGDGAALVGAAVFMACEFMAFWVGWSMSSVWAVLPLLLLGAHRLARGRRGGFGATVASSTLALLGGHPESVLHVSTVAFVVLLAEWPWRQGAAVMLPRLSRALLAALAAGALSAPAVLPFVEAMVQTADYYGRSRHHGGSLALDEAVGSAVAAIYPWGMGRPWRDLVEDKPRLFDQAGGAYVGGAALVLALLGVVRPCGHHRRRRWLFAGLGGVSLAVAVGMPAVADVVSRLPLFDLSLNGRLAAVSAFCLAVLAAFGAERLLGSAAARDPRVLATGAGALAAGGLLHLLRADLPAGVAASFVRSLAWTLLPAMSLAGLVAARRHFSAVGSVGSMRSVGTAALLALVLLPRAFERPDLYATFDPDLFFPPIPELAELPDFQRDGSEPYRVTAPYSDLLPATSALWHLEDVRGYAVMRHVRQHKTLSLWCERSTAWWFCQVRDYRKAFLSALNVRYLIGRPSLEGIADWTLVTRGENVSVWENPRVLSRAFAPATVLRLDPGAELPKAAHGVSDFGSVSAIEFERWRGPDEPPRAGDGRHPDLRQNHPAHVRTRAEGPDLRIEVEADEPAWIVISETPWKGWQAIDGDGDRLDLTYANLSMLAFRVEAGRHAIRLVYRPRSFLVGLALAGLAAVALLAAAIVAASRSRHRTTAAPPV